MKFARFRWLPRREVVSMAADKVQWLFFEWYESYCEPRGESGRPPAYHDRSWHPYYQEHTLNRGWFDRFMNG